MCVIYTAVNIMLRPINDTNDDKSDNRDGKKKNRSTERVYI